MTAPKTTSSAPDGDADALATPLPTCTTLRLAVDRGAMRIILDRPQVLNALSETMLAELEAVFGWLYSKDAASVSSVTIFGTGDRAFAAGADISGMAERSAQDGAAVALIGQRAMNAIASSPVPVIACVDGVAFGGGCELLAACDIVMATERSQFGQPEVTLGLIPGFGGCVRLPRLVGVARATYLILTGTPISAETAAQWGLVAAVLADEQTLAAEATRLEAHFRTLSYNALNRAKRALRREGISTESASGFDIEREEFALAFAHADGQEGMRAFTRRRKTQTH